MEQKIPEQQTWIECIPEKREKSISPFWKFLPILLLFPLYGYWYLYYPAHMRYLEETCFFIYSYSFLGEYMWQPGGWGEIASLFLSQFLNTPTTGAFVLTLLPLLTALSTLFILARLGLRHYSVLGYIPASIAACILCSYISPLYHAVYFVLFLIWAALYFTLKKRHTRVVVFTILFPVIYLCLPTAACIALYFTWLLAEILLKGSYKQSSFWMIGWFLLLILYPLLWQKYGVLIPDKNLYATANREWLYASLPISILLAQLLNSTFMRHPRVSSTIVWPLFIGLWGYHYIVCYDKPMEKTLQMDQAVQDERWDDVISVADSLRGHTKQTLYFTTIALLEKDLLGDNLFNYPVKGTSFLRMPQGENYLYNSFGAEIYKTLGIINEAIHLEMDAATLNPYDLNFRSIKRLIDFNIIHHDYPIALKYLDILEQASCYENWVNERRKEIFEQQWLNSQEAISINRFFYVYGKINITDDLGQMLEAYPANTKLRDLYLCALLLDKDLDTFCSEFFKYYPLETAHPLPRHYQEALMVAIASKNPNLSDKVPPFSPLLIGYFKRFNQEYSKVTKHDDAYLKMGHFGNTWWYYYLFIDENDTATE